MDICVICNRKMLNGQETNHKGRRIHKWCVKKYENSFIKDDTFDTIPNRQYLKGKNLKEIPISAETRLLVQAKFGRRAMLEL